jgi:hypothetical protein
VPHSVKGNTRRRPSLPRARHSAKSDTRQRYILPSVGHSANRDTRQSSVSCERQQTAVSFAECNKSDTRQSGLCRVLFVGTRQTLFDFFSFSTQTFCVVIRRYLEVHINFFANYSKCLLYSVNLFHLIAFLGIIQI